MVEQSHTAPSVLGDWWPTVYGPMKRAGQKISDFFAPEADAAATKDSYEINIELPGVSADDINVSVHDNSLTIKGEKHASREVAEKSFFFSERVYGQFQRSFRLPSDADAGKIVADFKDGVLTVKIAKTSSETSASRRIEVRHG